MYSSVEYDNFLQNSFDMGFWESGEYNFHRINWEKLGSAKKELIQFNQAGIYLWGIGNVPLYIGRTTKQTLAKRLNRYTYICNFAKKYSTYLIQGNPQKKISDLVEEFQLKNKKRWAKFIKCFGESGVDEVWFILIPLEKELTTGLEETLITVGKRWNRKKDYPDLINIDLEIEKI
ncbi:MAG: hypothetical protein IPN76_14565 [Saprospiraceae bacterium]|nr:hypothetical protein [Saprospiraceae bacterium]